MKGPVRLVAVCVGIAAFVGVANAASSPGVVTRSAAQITASTAILRGSVNPNGAPTGYEFQWGLTTAYGSTSAPRDAGAGTKPVAVQVRAAGLTPGTVYHYRLAALSKYGASLGADRTFRTGGHPPPGVLTGPATSLGSSTATLTGAVNPNGEATLYLFQYGLSSSYGQQTAPQAVPAGVPTTVSSWLDGLASGTTFHYRLVGLHGTAVFSYGSDQTFVSYPSPRPVPRVLASTKPRRVRHRPYVFTTYATIVVPRSLPPAVACAQGDVVIRYFFGRREVGFSLTPLQANCRLSSRIVLRHLFGRGKRRHRGEHLRVLIHFRGDSYLAPAVARAEHVVLG